MQGGGEQPILGPMRPHAAGKALELEIAEGLMMLENAVRLKLKNRIVVDTLTSGEGGPSHQALEQWAGLISDQLETFAAQSAESAQRLTSERDFASTADGLGRYYHDYRHLDTENLTRRVRIAVEVARHLRAMASDPKVVAELLAGARTLADDELSAAVRSTLSNARVVVPEDAALLEARIQQLADIDIPALAAAASRRREEQHRAGGHVRRLLALMRRRSFP